MADLVFDGDIILPIDQISYDYSIMPLKYINEKIRNYYRSMDLLAYINEAKSFTNLCLTQLFLCFATYMLHRTQVHGEENAKLCAEEPDNNKCGKLTGYDNLDLCSEEDT